MDSHFQLVRRIWNARYGKRTTADPSMTTVSLKSEPESRAPHILAWKLPDSLALDFNPFDSGYASAESSKGSISPHEDSQSIHSRDLPTTRRSQPPRLADIPYFAPLCTSLSSMPRTPGVGLRLPPTIVTRQMPLPIQNLPTLSPSSQSPTDPKSERLRRPSLQSVPSLTRIGREAPQEMESEMEDINEDDEEMEEDEEEDNADIEYDETAEVDVPGSPTSSNSMSIASVHTRSTPDAGHTQTPITSSSFEEHRRTEVDTKPQLDRAHSLSTPRPSRASLDGRIDHDNYFAFDTHSTRTASLLLPIINVTTAAATPSATSNHQLEGVALGDTGVRHSKGPLGPDTHHDPPTSPLFLYSPGLETHTDSNARASESPPSLPRGAAPAASLIPTPSPVESIPSEITTGRPPFYRQQSHSMTNLLPTNQLYSAIASAATLTAGYYDDDRPVRRVSRRTSMPSMQLPTYVASQKQNDPSFARFAYLRPQPREEEGMERLPPYDLTVPLLSALLLRKMEFSSPGILAKDRNWHRVWCVLQGTSFKVYEGEKGLEKIGGWIDRQKERVMMMEQKKGKGKAGEEPIQITAVVPGQGDERPKFIVTPSSDANRTSRSRSRTRTSRGSISSMNSASASSSRTSVHETANGSMSMSSSSSSSTLEIPPARSPYRRSIASTFQTIKNNVDERRERMRANMRSRGSMSSTSLAADNSMDSMIPPSSPLSMSNESLPVMDDPFEEISSITNRPLLRHYTLQNAESGVAIDYHKKMNVIRIRLEAEQFLLQLKNAREVIEWIEAFQSAADIALDLDERPMPRGPVFPRRRRRRPRIPEVVGSSSTGSSDQDLH